jgi:enolase
MSDVIEDIRAAEILDSRGNPTLKVSVGLQSGIHASASVPSGASTGFYEAHELRDGDKARYRGLGVLKAKSNVETVLAPALKGKDSADQAHIDQLMIELDGTTNKERLGANALLGVSMAVARAAALDARVPLYMRHNGPTAQKLPMPMINVINGGSHADNNLTFQEFMIVPVGAPTFAEAIRFGAETFHTLKGILRARGLSTAVGDEGGFAPDLKDDEAACALLVEAIERAGLRPGRDVAIALDPAASAFAKEGAYAFKNGDRSSSQELIQLYERWLGKYPIVSIEDGLAEDDWSGFQSMSALLGDRMQIVGDDLYVTNTKFIERGIAEKATNAVLIKLNQIGTLTETLAAIELCRKANWAFIISHRSGETEDCFIADLAVAAGGGQIKTGSLCRSERTAKYNRLLEIETELGPRAVFINPFSSRIQ